MKKIFAFALAMIMVVCTFSLVVSAAEEPLDFYAGVKEGTDAPKMDGKIGDGEYAVAIENLNPNDPECEYYKYLVYSNLSGGDKEPSGKSDTISFSIYMSIDDEYLYTATVEEDHPDSTWQGQPHIDNKAVTFIDFTLPSGAAFRLRLVSSSGQFDGFCQDVEENKIVPNEEDRAITNELVGDKRYITIEMKIAIADIEQLLGEKLPNTIYFAAFSRFDGDELQSYDDVVFQALDDDAVTGEFAGWIGCTLLRKCHPLHLNEEGKCAHRGMTAESFGENGHTLTCECGHAVKEEHSWNDEGNVCTKCDYTKAVDTGEDKEDTTTGTENTDPDETGDDIQEPHDDNNDTVSKDTGCGASVSLAGLALVAVLGLGATVISKNN